ncbi:major facilitator superfamily domain-containing protein 1 isoform X4 [Hemiscyllium ocellatum]|uniref:major facilitator superfamily domain-containing protein 1 isoform X4 n=1 Tax=Hemiscyllium ocellatum TaxID=170820 RepID=UPI002966BE4E|nr:major facilitator superfamily domain-containing protein 1 isoform X4 [Hemiscyllium ocellatum]
MAETDVLLPGEAGDRSRQSGDDGPSPGCAAALCDPRRWPHRFVVLVFMCFLGFGSYFCYDNPAALQTQVLSDMKVDTFKFMQLYAWYSWPNVILCFFGGFLLDKVFGVRLGTIIFSLFVCVGQVIVAAGALLNAFWLMELGRFVFGIGGESLAVAQNTYAVSWFKGKELNLVFGLQLSMARLGSTVNMNIMGWIYGRAVKMVGSVGHSTLGISLMIAAATCVFSLLCAFAIAYLDKRAKRILKKDQGKTGDVVKLTDVKDFPLSLWLIFIICVCYYVAIFPFIGLGKVFFIEKFKFSLKQASLINSMQSIQNLGLAVIAIAAGSILDSKGYLFLEVFFCACLCGALISVVMLYFVDLLTEGDLNVTAWKRSKLQAVAAAEAEKAERIRQQQVEDLAKIQPMSSFAVRNRYLSRLGAQLPENYSVHVSALAYRSVLK